MPNIDPKQLRKFGIHDVDIWPPPWLAPPMADVPGAAQIGRRGPGGGAGSVLKIHQACTTHIIKKHWHFRDRLHWNPTYCPTPAMGGAKPQMWIPLLSEGGFRRAR